MKNNPYIQYCLSLTGAYADYPFGPDALVVKVGSKMFAIISENSNPLNISLKCDPLIARDLRDQYPAVSPGYHLNKQHWNTVVVDGTIPDSEIKWMIEHSYALVVKGLTKAEKLKLAEQ